MKIAYGFDRRLGEELEKVVEDFLFLRG